MCCVQIACLADDVRPGLTTHRELDPTNMLSLVASLTPFSDYNQSPRNMYQVREKMSLRKPLAYSGKHEFCDVLH